MIQLNKSPKKKHSHTRRAGQHKNKKIKEAGVGTGAKKGRRGAKRIKGQVGPEKNRILPITSYSTLNRQSTFVLVAKAHLRIASKLVAELLPQPC